MSSLCFTSFFWVTGPRNRGLKQASQRFCLGLRVPEEGLTLVSILWVPICLKVWSFRLKVYSFMTWHVNALRPTYCCGGIGGANNE